MTNYGMPFMLEDQTGLLSGTEFIDVNDRLKYSYKCSSRNETETVFTIFDRTYTYADVKPLISISFTKDNHLNTISTSQGVIPVKKYLVKLSALGR
jgi:hypothetical protein